MFAASQTVALLSLALLLNSIAADGKQGPNWLLKCHPYTRSSGQQSPGAKGPCDNMCFAANSGQQPSVIIYRGPNNLDRDQGCLKNPCNANTGLPQYSRFGNSCDEYPLASTYRGPSGFRTLRCVPLNENQSQGGQFKKYLTDNSMQNGDSLRVGVEWDPNNAPFFCANAQEGASNPDRSEFKYAGGSFSNARRHARDVSGSSLFHAIEPALKTVARHDFLLSNGNIATLFGERPANVSDFWTDSSAPLSIVREISLADIAGMVLNATGLN